MYPPPGMKKLDTGQSDILFLANVPPPGIKKLDTGQSDILLLADVPPPPGMKKLDTGQSDILVLADVPPPPPQIEIGLNMNAIGKKSFQERSSSTFYQSTPPLSIIII